MDMQLDIAMRSDVAYPAGQHHFMPMPNLALDSIVQRGASSLVTSWSKSWRHQRREALSTCPISVYCYMDASIGYYVYRWTSFRVDEYTHVHHQPSYIVSWLLGRPSWDYEQKHLGTTDPPVGIMER